MPHRSGIPRRLPGLLAAALPVLLLGCGGSAVVVVCVGINTPPGFCKPGEHPADRVLTIRNNCPFPIEIAGIGRGRANASSRWTLTEHGSGGDSAQFHVPVRAQHSVSWSGLLVPSGSQGGSADLTFVRDGADIYKVEAPEGATTPLVLRPDQSIPSADPGAQRWCTPATSAQPRIQPHACRTGGVENRMDYVLTLCSTVEADQE